MTRISKPNRKFPKRFCCQRVSLAPEFAVKAVVPMLAAHGSAASKLDTCCRSFTNSMSAPCYPKTIPNLETVSEVFLPLIPVLSLSRWRCPSDSFILGLICADGEQ